MTGYGRVLRLAGQVPGPVWASAVATGSRAAALNPPRGLRQWQANAEVVLGRRPTRDETRRAAASWAQNLRVSAQLGDWSRQRILDSVEVDDADRDRLLAAHQAGGVVVALPHMGSWDLAGAWAGALGMPVSTVAEEIPEFDDFVAARQRLGFTVVGHRDPRAVAKLMADARAGRMVCLVTDRHFDRGGIPVAWQTATGPRMVRIPSGAALIARRTGATLLGCASHFTGTGRIRLQFSEPIVAHGAVTSSLVQQVADFFSAQVAADVTDWHVLVPFFDGVVAQ